ncbi:NADPH-dependent diflavin oxidoreductase 1 [Cytospora mali]|uniref:NADPH-dependent diflavin oxidoreductase 1 n=1 Tax=Cytospora mali TaxID=578113 RepID=A0A194VWV7_CYTMA|nr:NADPH-dependent diflavin oxidoreductase 1 [Valsa mali]
MEAEERPGEANGETLGNRSLLVLYGTETGNSQEIAQEIGRAAERLRFQTDIEEMNDVPLRELAQYSLAIFVTSTTGQGDVPVNAAHFWKSLLRKKLPPTCLSQLRFTTFGLGDSSYPKFNWAARKLQKRLLQLGAIEFHPAGEGDERHDNGIDSIYLPWFQDLKAKLLTECPLPDGVEPIPDDALLPPKYPITVAEMESNLPAHQRWEANREKHAALSHIENPKSETQERDDEFARRNDPSAIGQSFRRGEITVQSHNFQDPTNLDKDNILKDHHDQYDLQRGLEDGHRIPPKLLPLPGTFRAEVMQNKRITPESHWQDVRQLKLQVLRTPWSDDQLPTLEPGWTVVIYPKNFPADAEALIKLMGWEGKADKRIVWQYSGPSVDDRLPMTKKGGIRRPRGLYPLYDATMRDLLIHNIDFNAIPNRTFLKELCRHTEDEREKERLLELTHESDSQEFYDYTSRPRRTILEVLEDFPGVKIPMEYALETFPLIRGRLFSIANHNEGHESHKSKFHDIDIIAAMVEYKTIIRKPRQGLCSRYLKSLKPRTHLVVGLLRGYPPPSGEANFRRPLIAIGTGTGVAPIRSLIQERSMYKRAGDMLLFFGARNRDADFYYQKEWPRYKNLEVIPAFSRDPVADADKAFLDPYKQQALDVVKTEYGDLSPRAEPMDATNMPWLQSFDYDRGKMYIQHQVRRNAQKICGLIDRHAAPPIFVVCGNSGRMQVSVRRALEDALVLGGKAEDNEQAKKMLQDWGMWVETW